MSMRNRSDASPYSTGGGGVTLERAYGATLVAALLLGDPIPALGNDMRVVRVRLQAGPASPVDDYMVEGANSATGTTRRLSIGVRRNPTIAPSDEKFVQLLCDYIRIVTEHAAEVDADSWRVALAVAEPHTGAREVASLCDLARAHESNDSFRAAVAREGAHPAALRRRLLYLDDTLEVAVAREARGVEPGVRPGLAWRLLRALRVIVLRLEGDDAPDRTHAIARLRAIAEEPADAEHIFRSLFELTGRLAVQGGVLDDAGARRALQGIATLRGASAFAKAWSTLATCEEALRARTSIALTEPTSGNALSLARANEAQRLAAGIQRAGESASAVIVTGEPDVGKSALTLEAVRRVRTDGGTSAIFSLRDVPKSTLDFEHLLGGRLTDVFGGLPVGASRSIVVDGGESALEGKADLLAHLARAAFGVGIGIVVVTRSDAADAVRHALSVEGRDAPIAIAIPALTESEVAEILGTFPALSRIATEPSSRWLLGRPGLVDMLLRNGAHAALPDGALSEADVFNALWVRLVRKAEAINPGEATPDGREDALLALARKEFGSSDAFVLSDPLALASLRSDRLLLPVGTNAAWRTGDEFANDLVRDLAAARLLIKEGGASLLARSSAPRWSLRAARLACQTQFVRGEADTERLRTRMQKEFDDLASRHGERWSDIPWEAVLRLGSAKTVVEAAAPSLLGPRGNALGHLLRVVRQRFLPAGTTSTPDVALVEPVIEFLQFRRAEIEELPSGADEAADDLIVGWLAALALRAKDDRSNALRCRIRDRLIDDGESRERDVRCLALLGPDLDARADALLRHLALRKPGHLHPCVENSAASSSLAVHRPDLLLALSEAYYVKRSDSDAALWHSGPGEDGIRHHWGVGGLGSTLAGAHYGPFWHLLCARFRPTVALINRILNHAARHRVTRLVHRALGAYIATEEIPCVEIELPTLRKARFVGDDQVWRWYRGSGVGPYPCISALLALENLIDQLVAADTLLARIVPILLDGCENLAMAGLVVGTLVRYAEFAPGELDPWLANPAVWQLEIGRSADERLSRFHVQGDDPTDQPRRERRPWSPREVGYYLVSRALLSDDTQRLQTLTTVGDTLVSNALAEVSARSDASAESGAAESNRAAEEFVLSVRGWASCLQHAHFRVKRGADDRIAVQYEPPAAVTDAFESERRDYERGQDAWRLTSVYGTGEPATWSRSLNSDIALAHDLERDPPKSGPPELLRAPTAVAAGALSCAAAGVATLPVRDLVWAIDALARAATMHVEREFMSDQSVFPWGSDRLAARALPRALLLPLDAGDEARLSRVLDAVRALATSQSDEVRRIVATAIEPVWRAPCRRIGSTCQHAAILGFFRESSRRCRMAEVDPNMDSRRVVELGEDVEREMAVLPTRDLLMTRLIAPLASASDCARAGCCAAEAARELRDAVFELQLRGSAYYAEKNFLPSNDDDRIVAAALIDAGDEFVLRHVRTLAGQANALERLLRDLATVATADARRRRAFRNIWPRVMIAVLDAVVAGRDVRRERHGGARAFAAVVPHPIPTGQESNLENVLRSASEDWPIPSELAEPITRWLPLAAGSAEAIDALVGLLQTRPIEEQATRLQWVAALVIDRFGGVAGRSYRLPAWLEKIHGSGLLDVPARSMHQRIVDGLAAAGDSRALQLQTALDHL
jgi:hypothetical protein